MTRPLEPTRRGFLLTAAGVLSGLFWPGCGGPSEADRERLAGIIVDLDGPCRVGGAVLERGLLEEDTAERLARAIYADLGRPAATSDAALAERLAALIERDFEEGRLTRLDGWWLSLTEARLSALVFLSRCETTGVPGAG